MKSIQMSVHALSGNSNGWSKPGNRVALVWPVDTPDSQPQMFAQFSSCVARKNIAWLGDTLLARRNGLQLNYYAEPEVCDFEPEHCSPPIYDPCGESHHL
jgi:hypothetical protein